MIININHEIIEVDIERTKRKTLSIQLREDASVLVKAPLLLSEEKIRSLLEQKADWLLEKRNEIKRKQKKRIYRTYETGATLPYLGKEYHLTMISGKKSDIDFIFGNEADISCGFFISGTDTDKENMQKLLKKWYKKRTYEEVNNRIAYYSRIMNVSVTSVSIKSRKREWGSCDSNGNLTFNWKLAMARPTAIDYVVVHELCHRKFMDHSRQFWKEVEKYIPDYKEEKMWLNENGMNMEV